jgi:FKBP-type peptidyl-prolyl cis-trans isomerase FkpA
MKMWNKLLVGVLFIASSCLNTDPGTSAAEQFQKDVKAIDNYLQSNAIDAIKHLQSGLRLQIHQLGSGYPAASTSNIVKVNYTGKLLSNGVTFDSGQVNGALSQYISGWQIALSLLPEGTSATIYIPSLYGYGTRGSGSVPANAVLVFDIEILSITYSNQQKSQIQLDTTAIKNYLNQNNITHEVDPTGVRYKISQLGTGEIPTWFDKVKFSYSAKLLNGTLFSSETVAPNANFNSYVNEFIFGLKAGLQLIPVGSKVTFYIPSTLAYGTRGTNGVPPDTNVVYEIELLEILP